MGKTIRGIIPNKLKRKIKRFYYFPFDAISKLLHRNDLIPPKGLINIGSGDFRKIGNKYLTYFIDVCHLQPDEHILDVGCGIGRMAIPLTSYISNKGYYEGFDIVPRDIKWCQNNITPKFPNFTFRLSNIYNKTYNPKGMISADEYIFPYEDETFDFVFLTSVFSHMLQKDMEKYLSEISRVLKESGRCLITFYLINDESREYIANNNSTMIFKHNLGGHYTTNINEPEAAVAYEENLIRNLYDKYGLRINDPIFYGSWCGRDEHLDYQDIILAYKNVIGK